MIEGRTTIELTNTGTGEKKTTTDKNMLTNALRQATTAYGALGINFLSVIMDQVNTTGLLYLFKGLVLFDSNIEENPDSFLIPEDIKEVGRGCDLAYTGIDTNMGSFNEEESRISEDRNTIKLVWDFSTNQANGQIKCACLLPLLGGRIGFSHKVWDNFLRAEANAGYPMRDWRLDQKNVPDILYMDYVRRMIVIYGGIDKTAKEIILTKYRLPIRDVFVSDCRYIEYGGEEIRIPIKEDAALTNPTYVSCGTLNGCIDFVIMNNNSNTIDAGGILTINRYHVDTGETTYIEITNTTGKQIRMDDKGANFSSYVILGDYIYVVASDYTLYRINLGDNTDVSQITMPEEQQSLTDNFWGFRRFHMDHTGWLQGFYTTKSYGRALMQFMVNGTEAGYTTASANSYYSRIYGLDGTICITRTRGNEKGFSPGMNPWALYTINNLATPVTKTAVETMKVTYTLTLQEETT